MLNSLLYITIYCQAETLTFLVFFLIFVYSSTNRNRKGESMADSDPRDPGNMDTKIRSQITVGGGQSPVIIGLNPHKLTAIHVNSGLENAKVSVTTDLLQSDSTKLVAFDANTMWHEVAASGVVDYFAGDSTLLSGVMIEGTPGTSSIQYSVTQRGKG